MNGTVRALAMLVWLLALGAMASAAIVAKSGAALACASWPLCDDALLPDLSDPLVRLNVTHRLLAAGVGLGTLMLWASSRAMPAARALANLALVLVAAEILLGGLVVLWGVPLATAVAHQALGVLAFGALTWLMWRLHAPAGEVEGLHVRGLSRA